ncbi:MAG: DUF3341 domain-containing protein [Caldilineae bacterium]|nr:MAG: DUF3341 domain-containing protein [Caldilineae bacterium]
MSDTVLLALFDDVEPVADTLDSLRREGISENDMVVVSGVPYPARVLGRPMVWERLPLIAISGAFVGFLVGVFLNAGTPLLYPVHVGGQPLIPLPPSLVITYEFTMMGLIVSTFLGVLWESTFPSYGPKYYERRISSEGDIGILFRCPQERVAEFETLMRENGAEDVVEPEAKTL